MSKNLLFWKGRLDMYFNTLYRNTLPAPKIHKIESDVLTNLSDKNVLNILCNFGMTCFAIENKAYSVTGLDFNPVAIKKANQIKGKINSKCKFIESDILEYETSVKYDIIYASFGIINWISDLDLFFKKIYKLLNKGGKFILVEYHSNLSKEILKDLSAIHIKDNNYNISANIKTVENTEKTILGGNSKTINEKTEIDFYLYDTEFFVKLSKKYFLLETIKYYNYLPFKRLNSDIKISNGKYRHRNLKTDDNVCYSIVLKKE